MKFAIAALFASASALKIRESPDCPDSTTVFSYNERVAAAAGLAQKEHSLVQFATGMNGDEDLEQNIIMKGEKYHYNQESQNIQLEQQWVPVVVKSTGPLPVCTGTNGLDGTNCARAVCNGTNGPKDGPAGTPCTREEPASIPHYNTEPTAGQRYQDTGNLTPTHPSALDPPAPISAALL